jgi:Rps23 Pro-64 3,4-dihydroxylase Tpa1-like proline 4-hydroxylase
LIVIDNVIHSIDSGRLCEQVRNAKPFPHLVIDDFLDEDFAREIVRSWPDFQEAAKVGKEFNSLNERNKVQVTDATYFPQPLRELNDALASQQFLDTLSQLFQIPSLLADSELVGGGLHQTGPRGHLDVHVDFNYIAARQLHRRLNILIYFNENWRPEWGGKLELWNNDVTECIHSLDPKFNRCVIFETSEISFHGVTAVTCPDGAVRRSFAGYYYTEAAPDHWTGDSHTTIFKARPDEKMKSRLMAINSAKRFTKDKIKSMIGRPV